MNATGVDLPPASFNGGYGAGGYAPVGTVSPMGSMSPEAGTGYGNPFRSGGAPTYSGGNEVPGLLGNQAVSPAPAAPSDPLSQDIDQNIAQLRNQMAPKVQAGFGIRARSGRDGLDGLTEEFTPLEATYSPGIGELKLQVTPTFLQAGSVKNFALAKSRFGSLPLYAGSANAPDPGSQDASGVGLDVGYGWQWISGDIGSTPVGFREQNIIGGIELAPKLSPDLTLRIVGERRAVTDSVLSYAGTQDVRTGENWGGVTRTRGHAQLEYGHQGLNLYAGGGYSGLDGERVQSNSQWEAGAGGSYPVYRGSDDEVRVGLDLVYFGYDHNLDFFTLGAGGYFSPQSYFAALIPVTYRQTQANFTWSVGASVGFQTFRAASSPIFPGNQDGLQTQLAALAANNPQLALYYPGQNSSGFAGGAQAEGEYHLTPAFSIGARAGVQHTGNFTEGGGMIFAKYAFGVGP